jgi:hypothetical protein
MPSYDRALRALRTWLDSWSGVGHVAVGMHRQGFDLQLTQYDDRRLARDVLRGRHGALADERDGHSSAADRSALRVVCTASERPENSEFDLPNLISLR